MARRHVRDPNASARSRRNSDLMAGQTGEFETISVTGGVVGVGRTLPPSDKVDKLYNDGGDLLWNGLSVTSQGRIEFAALDDTPASYDAKSLQLLRVNLGATAVEFTDEVDGGAI